MTALLNQPPQVSPTRSPPASTPDDLLRVGQQGLFELVNVQLVEKPMSFEAGKLTTKVSGVVGDFVERNQLGEVFNPAVRHVRPYRPDVSSQTIRVN